MSNYNQSLIEDYRQTIERLQQECTEKTNAIIALGEHLKAKEQECEELKEYIREREVWGDQCEFCKHNDKENCHQNIILDNLKTINSYRKALEEIEDICKNGVYDEFGMPLDECGFILDIIDKAKEKE